MNCEICGSSDLIALQNFARLRRVTSDCRAFARGGQLFRCRSCRTVQKKNDAQWRAECTEIYSTYNSYSLSEGIEQSVRTADGAQFAPRSEIILRRLRDSVELPQFGRLLDFGCGKGPTLRAAARVLRGWTFDGLDQDDRALESLQTVEGFETLHIGDPRHLPSNYDLIVLMHTLEHLPDPVSVLKTLVQKLRPGGHILCQVPDRNANPYDLLVADHLVHFDSAALYAAGTQVGVGNVRVMQNWITKELSLLLPAHNERNSGQDDKEEQIEAQSQVDWLLDVAEFSRRDSRHRPFCIFGTSIVATWLASELTQPPDLYLDDDPAKIGRFLDGVPIIAPDQAPPGATIALALAPIVASAIVQRLAHLDLHFVMLPAYPPNNG